MENSPEGHPSREDIQRGCPPSSVEDSPPPVEDPTERSRQLLLAWLSPEQRLCFKYAKCFTVKGGDTGSYYLIECQPVYNIISHDDERYCVTLEGGRLPIYDQLLAQKIWLETDELGTLKIANKRGRLGPFGPFFPTAG